MNVKRKGKRWLAFLLALCMAFSPVFSSVNVYAAENDGIAAVSGGDAENVIACDFESETGNWGFTGDLSGNINVTSKSDTGNHLLLSRSGEKKGTVSATKTFADMPEMTSAKIAFEWSTLSLTSASQAGFLGIALLNGDREILTLYYDELRAQGSDKNRGNIWYSVNGETKVDTGTNVEFGSVHNVIIDLDFANHTLDVTMDDSTLLEDVKFPEIINKVDSLKLGQYGDGVTISNVNMGIDDFSMSWEAFTGLGEEYNIVNDFEDETGNWGFTGDLSGNISVTSKSDAGKYLLLSRSGEKKGTVSATKSFSDMPQMATAKIAFEWSTLSLTSASQAGFLGISLLSGDNDILTLYYDELRAQGSDKNRGNIWYSVNGETKVDTGTNVEFGSVHDVVIDLDFANHTLDVTMDDSALLEDVGFPEIINKVDSLKLGQYGDGVTISNVNMGIDDFAFTYVEQLSTGNKEVYIYELATIADVTLTKEAYEAAGNVISHPQTVSATLSDGSTVDVSIDQSSWTCSPSFDANVKGAYKWTANIVAPEGTPNKNNLTTSYILLYRADSVWTHDYQNDFTFSDDLNKFAAWTSAWGGNNAGFTTTIARDDENSGYMHATVTGNGERATYMDIPDFSSKVVTGVEVQFDWKLINCNNNSGGGLIMFVAPDKYHSYFAVRFDKNYDITYFTESLLSTGSKQTEFEGMITSAAAQDTGLGGEGKWYTVNVKFDYSAHTADLTITPKDGAEAEFTKTGIPIEPEANGLKTFFMDMNRVGNGASVTMGLDNLLVDYEEISTNSIASVAAIENVRVGKADWASYQHPAEIEVTLGDGTKQKVALGEWTATPSFDENTFCVYTWTAPLISGDIPNPLAIQATYTMSYVESTESQHDYEEDFSFGIWDIVAWGKEMDGDNAETGYSGSGGGTMPLVHAKDDNGNFYMQVNTGEQNAERGNRLDLGEEIVKGATVSFDWMPQTCNDISNGQIMFLAPGSWNPYLTLRFDSEFNIRYFTKCPLVCVATEQKEFAGAIAENAAVDTGLGEANKWFTINLEMDYLAHTVDLTVTEKDNPTNTVTFEDIAIATEANGIKSMVLHLDKTEVAKPNATWAMDNIIIDFDRVNESDIVSIVQPSDVKVAKEAFDSFVWPTEVEATLGDGSTTKLQVGKWTSTPAFDKETESKYTWTAPLVTGDLNNIFNLGVSFDMDYTMLPFPLYVHNPNTVELEFGEAMPKEFPTEVVAFMSDGTVGTMAVGKWTAIREFNPDVEGIYVYGANLEATPGKDQIVREQLNRNENHDDHGSDKDAYVYDVYYRISNFKSDDNYNAYTRSMEYLDRGVYAVAADNGIFVSWRLLVTEYGEDVSFNIYRNGELVNAQPITSKTNYVDVNGKAGDSYTVVKLQDGLCYESEAFVALDKGYMSIPMQKPAAMPSKTGEMAEYTLNDAGVADVDGDGQYEVIVKWYPTNSFDSGKAVKPSSPTIFDVYEMDGTALWRLNLGLEMPSGAHFNQFMFYDLDEDGKAELFIKTSDGSVTYKPNAEGKFDMTDESTIVSYIGDKSVVPGTNVNSNGHVSAASNEYVTVFNGMTGEEIDTIDYVNTTGLYSDWHYEGKDDGGNRSARYNIAIAYLPEEEGSTETIPAVLLNRGYYAKTTVAAYTLRDGKLKLDWNFVVDSKSTYAEKGNHNMSTGDMDNDGFDELVIGAMAIDHDGTVLWAKDAEEGRDYSGHADAIHLAAMMPDTNQLYVVVPSENKTSTLNYSVTNAATGVRIAGQFMTKADIGRGIAANITPDAGFEYWANVPNSEIANQAPSGAIYNIYGGVIAQEKPVNFTTNWRLFWDGDLLSELPDSYNPSIGEGAMSIFKYNWETKAMDTLTTFTGTKLNNATKNNPSLSADLFGDWREEVMLRSEDSTELRIYMTSEETDYMIYTLMHDPVYRNAVANQNTAYNQPPQLGFYLGEDNKDTVLAMGLPTANIAYTVEEPEGTEPSVTPAPTAEPTVAPEVTAAPTAAPGVTEAPTAAPEVTVAPVVTQAPSSGSADSNHIVIDENMDWREVTDVIASITTDEYTVVDIDLGLYNILSSEVLSAIQGKNITIAITQDNGVEFRINGRDVESARDMNLRVILDSGVFAAERLTPFAGYSVRQISLEHDGNFGFTATVRIPTDSANNGKYASLFWDNNGRFEFQGSSKITDGYAAFEFTHASDYVMVVSENPLSVKSPTTGDELVIVERSNNYGAVLGVLAFFAIVTFGAGMVVLKKKEEN